MPTPLSSVASDCSLPLPADSAQFANARPSTAPAASFETYLTQTPSGKSAEECAASEDETAGDGAKQSDAPVVPLSPEQLAAMLAFLIPLTPPAQPARLEKAMTLDAEGSSGTPVAPDAESQAFASPDLTGSSRFSSAVPARQLIGEGAAVIDYRLTPQPIGSLPETPPVSLSPSPESVEDALPASPAPAVPASPVPVGAIAPSTASSADIRAVTEMVSASAQEKIAASSHPASETAVSGVKPSIRREKNNFLTPDQQEVAKPNASLGTSIANWGEPMRSVTPSPLISPPAEMLAGTSQALSGESARPAQETAQPAAHAAKIVTEIRDIADTLSSVERNSVELRFHFTETERLSVRVEYRQGVVQTTFRTDSPELRDTLAREWQAQLSQGDSRPYRVADPVFQTPAPDARGFSLGGDSSRQQRPADQPAPAFSSLLASAPRDSVHASANGNSAGSTTRSDNSVHLHAFA